MSIIDRIKHLKPKQWAMIVGGVGVVGLSYDYYRRREGSLLGRAIERIHPSPPPPLPPPSQQRRPSAPGMPSMPSAPSFDMGDMGGEMMQMPMGGEVIVEEMPGFYYAPYYQYGGSPWRGRAWWPHEQHGFGPRHEFRHGARPAAPHAQQQHPSQHGAPPQQHGAQQPQQQQQQQQPPPHHH